MSDTPDPSTPPAPDPAPAPFDWCAEAARLRKVLTDAATGDNVVRGRNRAGEDEREIQFAPANIPLLRQLLAEAEEKCAISQGQPARRRFAIQARSGRRGLPIYP